MEEKKDILSNIILVNNINNDENIGALLNSVKNSQKSINQISKKIAAKEVTLKNNKKAESSPLSESDGNAEAFVAAPISQTVSNIGETPVKEIKTEISPETETVAKTNEAMVSEIKKTEAVSNEKSEKATVSAEKVSETASEPVKLEKGPEIIKSEPETVKQAAVSAKTEQTVKPFKKDIVRS